MKHFRYFGPKFDAPDDGGANNGSDAAAVEVTAANPIDVVSARAAERVALDVFNQGLGTAPNNGQKAREALDTSAAVTRDEADHPLVAANAFARQMKAIIARRPDEFRKNAEHLVRIGAYGREAQQMLTRAAGDWYSTVVDADGGYLLPTMVRDGIEEIAEIYGAARQLANVWPHRIGSIKVPAGTGSIVFSAVAEGAAIASSIRAFQVVTLNPQKWAAIVPWTYEVGIEAGQKIMSDFLRAAGRGVAYAEDDAMINGDGTATYNSITGLLVDASVVQYQLATGNTTYEDVEPDDFLLVRNDIAPSLRSEAAYVLHPDMEAVMLSKKDGAGNYVFPIETRNELRVFKGARIVYTEVLPPTSTGSQANTDFGLFGAFRLWHMAVSEAFTSEELREAIVADADTGTDFNLATQDGRALKMRTLFDMATNFPEGFAKFTTSAT